MHGLTFFGCNGLVWSEITVIDYQKPVIDYKAEITDYIDFRQ